jgi:hypothetical protein
VPASAGASDTTLVTVPGVASHAVPESSRAALSRGLVAALVITPALVITWAFRPGYMNADTLNAYAETKPWGYFNDFHSPLIVKLWDVFETAGVGSPTIVLFAQTLTMTAGLYLVFRAVLGRVPAALVSGAVVFSPLVLSQVMLIGKDTWMTSFVLLQVGCGIRFVGSSGRARQVWLGLVVVSGLLVLAARPNSPPVELLVVAALVSRVYADRASDRSHGRARAMLVPLALGGVAIILGFAIVSTLPRLMGARHASASRGTYAYDLAGMSVHENEVLMGPAAFPSQDLDLLRERWDPRLVESVIIPLGEGPVRIVEPAENRELERAWREHLLDRPGAYLAVRWELFSRMLGISHPPTYVVHPGVDVNPWGFAIANPDGRDALLDYIGWFTTDDTFVTGSDLFRPWIWLGLGLASACVLLSRPVRTGPGALEVGLTVVGALLYEATFAVTGMSEGFRYSYPSIVLSLVGVVFALATLGTKLWARTHPSPVADSAPDPIADSPAIDRSADEVEEPLAPVPDRSAELDGASDDSTVSSR